MCPLGNAYPFMPRAGLRGTKKRDFKNALKIIVKRTRRIAFPQIAAPLDVGGVMKKPPLVKNPTARNGAKIITLLKSRKPLANKDKEASIKPP
jgi:hypothetical protein